MNCRRKPNQELICLQQQQQYTWSQNIKLYKSYAYLFSAGGGKPIQKDRVDGILKKKNTDRGLGKNNGRTENNLNASLKRFCYIS